MSLEAFDGEEHRECGERCIECYEKLRNFELGVMVSKVKYCSNNKCSRYGLMTVAYTMTEEQNQNEEV